MSMKINLPLHFPIGLAILFLMEPVNAQLSPDLAALEKVISGSATSGGISGPESEEYKSLTQFEYENIVRNIIKLMNLMSWNNIEKNYRIVSLN